MPDSWLGSPQSSQVYIFFFLVYSSFFFTRCLLWWSTLLIYGGSSVAPLVFNHWHFGSYQIISHFIWILEDCIFSLYKTDKKGKGILEMDWVLQYMLQLWKLLWFEVIFSHHSSSGGQFWCCREQVQGKWAEWLWASFRLEDDWWRASDVKKQYISFKVQFHCHWNKQISQNLCLTI